jgi:hypothetical protein
MLGQRWGIEQVLVNSIHEIGHHDAHHQCRHDASEAKPEGHAVE